MTDIPDWLVVLIAVPMAILIIGFWSVLAIAVMHFIKTAHLDNEEDDA